jgi:hypothetical protein
MNFEFKTVFCIQDSIRHSEFGIPNTEFRIPNTEFFNGMGLHGRALVSVGGW